MTLFILNSLSAGHASATTTRAMLRPLKTRVTLGISSEWFVFTQPVMADREAGLTPRPPPVIDWECGATVNPPNSQGVSRAGLAEGLTQRARDGNVDPNWQIQIDLAQDW